MTCFIVFGLPRWIQHLFDGLCPAGPWASSCRCADGLGHRHGDDMVNLSTRPGARKDHPGHPGGYHCHRNLLCPDCRAAGGVLPVSETANQPLDLVARAIMPSPVFLFFVIGGALLALTTTLNATSHGSPSPSQACSRRLAAP